MEDMAVTIPEIRALVSERQRFDDWLTALEARRDETPIRVFERVHADYLARRDAVIENLHTHVGSLESMERDLNERLQSLETKLAEREDERAEAMLRTAVGEFDSERWETTRHEVEASLAQLGQDREALIAETEDVRGLLASARYRPAAPEPEVQPEPEPLVVATADDTQQELVSTNVAAAIAHADPAAVEHTTDLNVAGNATQHSTQYQTPYPTPHHAPTLEVPPALITTDPYLRAVKAREAQADADIESAFAVSDSDLASLTGGHEVSSFGRGNTSDNGAKAHAEAEDERESNAAIDALGAHTTPRHTDSLDDIDVFGESKLSSNMTPRASAPETATPRSHTDSFAPPAPNAAQQNTPPSMPHAAPARDAFDDLAFLRSITDTGTGASAGSGTTRTGGSTDQAKTLRCTECGTMNFPTEWYCERCGGELAAF